MPQDPTLPRVRDFTLFKTVALPNGAATTTSAGIDINSNRHMHGSELLVAVPALAVGQLADTTTVTYSVEFSAASDFGTVSRSVTVGVQTGAGGVGAAADEYRTAIESTADRYVRLKAVKTGVANASAATASIGVTTPA